MAVKAHNAATQAAADKRRRLKVAACANLEQVPCDPNKQPPTTSSELSVANLTYMAAHGLDTPLGYRDAIKSPNADKWWQAMEEELNMLKSRGTWKMVKLPKGWKVIGN